MQNIYLITSVSPQAYSALWTFSFDLKLLKKEAENSPKRLAELSRNNPNSFPRSLLDTFVRISSNKQIKETSFELLNMQSFAQEI